MNSGYILITLTGNLWYSAVWRGALSAVVVGGFSDSSWTGAYTPGRDRRWRGKENQVMRGSCNTTVIAGLSRGSRKLDCLPSLLGESRTGTYLCYPLICNVVTSPQNLKTTNNAAYNSYELWALCCIRQNLDYKSQDPVVFLIIASSISHCSFATWREREWA